NVLFRPVESGQCMNQPDQEGLGTTRTTVGTQLSIDCYFQTHGFLKTASSPINQRVSSRLITSSPEYAASSRMALSVKRKRCSRSSNASSKRRLNGFFCEERSIGACNTAIPPVVSNSAARLMNR